MEINGVAIEPLIWVTPGVVVGPVRGDGGASFDRSMEGILEGLAVEVTGQVRRIRVFDWPHVPTALYEIGLVVGWLEPFVAVPCMSATRV